ncbi:MAG: hypothetical protein AAGA05_09615 [Pseudomonadota bacterium]
MRLGVLISVCLCLSGCAEFQALFPTNSTEATAAPARQTPNTTPEAVPRPPLNPSRGPLPTTGLSVDAFDTTTDAERAEATGGLTGGAGSIGTTVAGLGDPARPGFWIETPLVESEGPGRVVYAATGQSVQVKLIPVSDPDTSGSRLSLATMRLLEAPISDLVEVEVFAGT